MIRFKDHPTLRLSHNPQNKETGAVVYLEDETTRIATIISNSTSHPSGRAWRFRVYDLSRRCLADCGQFQSAMEVCERIADNLGTEAA